MLKKFITNNRLLTYKKGIIMSQFLKMVSSNNFINTTNIEKPNKDIQNQQINSIAPFKQASMREVGHSSMHKPLVIANTLFA
jgi:hypothetical protein